MLECRFVLTKLPHLMTQGIAILDPAPLYQLHAVKFRMADVQNGECSASECGLICKDYWSSGYGRIMMVPRVKLSYDSVRKKSRY